MVSFATVWEMMDKSPLMDSGEDTRGSQVIRAGEQLRNEGDPSFWDDFLTILSNTDGVAELLNVSTDKVLSWPSRIRDARQKMGREKPKGRDGESKVVPTGDNGAIVASNQDPVI